MNREQEHVNKVEPVHKGYDVLQDKLYMFESPYFTRETETTFFLIYRVVIILINSDQRLINQLIIRELNKRLESQTKYKQATKEITTGLPKGSNSYGDGGLIVSNRRPVNLLVKVNQIKRTYSTKAEVKQISSFNDGMELISQLKKNDDGRYSGLYKLVYSKELLLAAYNSIKSNPGNMTPGTDNSTLDTINAQTIEKLSDDLKKETFKFTKVKRIFIPKKNGKLRPLGIPNIKDKLVQKTMTMVLTLIYENKFSDLSHGFRPHRSTHTALREISK